MSLDDLNFSSSAWTCKFLPSEHKETGIWSCGVVKVNSSHAAYLTTLYSCECI